MRVEVEHVGKALARPWSRPTSRARRADSLPKPVDQPTRRVSGPSVSKRRTRGCWGATLRRPPGDSGRSPTRSTLPKLAPEFGAVRVRSRPAGGEQWRSIRAAVVGARCRGHGLRASDSVRRGRYCSRTRGAGGISSEAFSLRRRITSSSDRRAKNQFYGAMISAIVRLGGGGKTSRSPALVGPGVLDRHLLARHSPASPYFLLTG